MRTAVIGVGYWGQNMLRVIHDHPDSVLVSVCDALEASATSAADRYGCSSTTNPDVIFSDPTIDAVYLATPPSTHYALAKAALTSGKHVLVEKPITTNSETASHLIELASIHERTLMVGHTFLYSPPVLKVRELITTGVMGEIFYLESQRVNLGKYQDSGVLWDLAPHDLSIALYWLGEAPSGVVASGRSYRSSGREDVVFFNVDFPSGTIAQIHLSWLAPVKLRRTTLSGSQRMAVYDDTAGPEAVKIFNHGVDPSPPETFGEFQLSYRQGDIWIPRLESSEPLRNEWAHFVHCVRTGETPRSSGLQGMQIVKIIECAERALDSGKREVIEWGRPANAQRPPRFGVSAEEVSAQESVTTNV